jgi:predicted amidohydrolase YtcJ
MLRIALAMAAAAAAGVAGAADVTVLTNARIVTMDPSRPYGRAMAFDAGGKILAVGSEAEVAAAYPEAAKIDVEDQPVVPGLIDAHGHVLGLGLALSRADLVGATSKAETLDRLREYESTLPAGDWLLGRGWDQNDWPEKSFPTAADLDKDFPDRPVWLERIDGHAGWANTAAMKKVERDLDGDWQVDGGRIVRDDGKATGVFVDTAAGLVDAVVPPPSPALAARALQRAMAEAAHFGLTGVHDAGVSKEVLALYRILADADNLPIRVYAMADGDGAALDALCADGVYKHANGRLQMRALKLYADGALGSRGAMLLEDYADDAGNRGLPVMSEAALETAARKAKGCGVQVATHAIGDRGNRVALDVYERVLGDDRAGDHRWRIEHAQVVAPADIARFATLRTIASMQPTHATSDMPWAELRVGGARIVGAYAWRRMRDSGVRLALGSDFPVESANPMLGLYSAILRQDAEAKPAGGWYPDQRLTAWEALRGFTLDAAYAGFAEAELGSLEPGKRADFVVLDVDPVRSDPKAVREGKAIATYIDGKPTWRAYRM